MANLFDSSTAPTTEPENIVIGSFFQWKRTDLGADYPPSLYTLKYTARVQGGGDSEINITATASGSDFLATITNTVSAAFLKGSYVWQADIERNSDGARVTVDKGYWEIVADLNLTSADLRTHAQIMIGKIESILSGRADSDVSSYSIAGRSLSKMSFRELTDARDHSKRARQKETLPPPPSTRHPTAPPTPPAPPPCGVAATGRRGRAGGRWAPLGGGGVGVGGGVVGGVCG